MLQPRLLSSQGRHLAGSLGWWEVGCQEPVTESQGSLKDGLAGSVVATWLPSLPFTCFQKMGRGLNLICKASATGHCVTETALCVDLINRKASWQEAGAGTCP